VDTEYIPNCGVVVTADAVILRTLRWSAKVIRCVILGGLALDTSPRQEIYTGG
jgi:hypothetical protein